MQNPRIREEVGLYGNASERNGSPRQQISDILIPAETLKLHLHRCGYIVCAGQQLLPSLGILLLWVLLLLLLLVVVVVLLLLLLRLLGPIVKSYWTLENRRVSQPPNERRAYHCAGQPYHCA